MAKIKSAIELAMERTKNLVMDEKEKEEFARRGLEDKLRAVMRRFLEGMTGRESFSADSGASRGKREKRLLLVDLAFRNSSIQVIRRGFFELLELVGEEAGSGLGGEARSLKDRFREGAEGQGRRCQGER